MRTAAIERQVEAPHLDEMLDPWAAQFGSTPCALRSEGHKNSSNRSVVKTELDRLTGVFFRAVSFEAGEMPPYEVIHLLFAESGLLIKNSLNREDPIRAAKAWSADLDKP